MKTKILFITLSFLLAGFNFSLSAKDKNNKEVINFFVKEMHCTNCKARIEKNIAFEKGVTDLACDLESKTVKVTYKKNQTSPEKLIKGFEKIGMTAVDSAEKENEKENTEKK